MPINDRLRQGSKEERESDLKLWVSLALLPFTDSVETPSPSDFRFEITTPPDSQWRSQILTYPKDYTVVLYVHLDAFYTEYRAAWVQKLVRLLNVRLVVGCFEVDDARDGALIFRNSVWVGDFRHEPKVIAAMLDHSAFGLRVFEAAFAEINHVGTSPEAAVEAALLEVGGVGSGKLSKDGVKAMMKVVKGSSRPA